MSFNEFFAQVMVSGVDARVHGELLFRAAFRAGDDFYFWFHDYSLLPLGPL